MKRTLVKDTFPRAASLVLAVFHIKHRRHELSPAPLSIALSPMEDCNV